jgi:hypothetical protein
MYDFWDIGNSAFITGGALVTTLNIWAIYRDKKVSGVSIWPAIWFIAWGIWNLFYYHHLKQPYSWWVEVAIVLSNVIWLGLVGYYKVKRMGEKGGTQTTRP